MYLLQKELKEMMQEWNIHRIRKSKNSICCYGRPITMFEIPEEQNTIDFIHTVEISELQLCKNENMYSTNICCDETVYELCNIILAEKRIAIPDDPYSIIDYIYIMLRNTIQEKIN
ncbi:unnamed protein product [Macrosiphum euphorbiae]|uniref:Uncharacterized protein n=1 Tax=Macrosiphum euphorbiae TaxID=13131 RepID=A0AAV0Y6P4_9HEMI|nr:unnamed protein product [Macrosiphum euphorbiae]